MAITLDKSGQRRGVLTSINAQLDGRMTELGNGSSAMMFAALTQADSPAGTPVGLTLSGDEQYLLLADGDAHAVRVFDTRTRRLVNTIPLDFAPSRLEPLSSAPTFLLNSEGNGQWLLVLDARRVPGVSFVPANREEAR